MGNEIERATEYIRLRNRLLEFEFNGDFGFIEPVPDYHERKSLLDTHKGKNFITAVMIGTVGSNPIDWAFLETWFPFNFLRLLSLATGSKVGAPWIEFRDDTGKLIRRIYKQLDVPEGFSEGHPAIYEPNTRGGIGHLLTIFPSEHYAHSYLGSVIEHIIEGDLSHTIEGRLSHFFRAFDCLLIKYGLDKQYLNKELTEPYKAQVSSALHVAAQNIKSIAKDALSSGCSDVSEAIEEIARRTESTPVGKSNAAGQGIADLLRSNDFSFPDADIIDGYYRLNPRVDGKRTWSQVLTWYRGEIVHRGYVDFHRNQLDEDAYIISKHLHDLLLRIVLKKIGYNRTYQRAVTPYRGKYSLDWVAPNTPASELGYLS